MRLQGRPCRPCKDALHGRPCPFPRDAHVRYARTPTLLRRGPSEQRNEQGLIDYRLRKIVALRAVSVAGRAVGFEQHIREEVMAMNVNKPRFHGERVRALRYQRRLSARKVAKRAGIHWRYYLRLEKNERPNVSAVNAAAIALALGTSMEYLMGLTDDPRPIAAIWEEEDDEF